MNHPYEAWSVIANMRFTIHKQWHTLSHFLTWYLMQNNPIMRVTILTHSEIIQLFILPTITHPGVKSMIDSSDLSDETSSHFFNFNVALCSLTVPRRKEKEWKGKWGGMSSLVSITSIENTIECLKQPITYYIVEWKQRRMGNKGFITIVSVFQDKHWKSVVPRMEWRRHEEGNVYWWWSLANNLTKAALNINSKIEVSDCILPI